MNELAERMEVEDMAFWNRSSSYPRVLQEMQFAAWRWPVLSTFLRPMPGGSIRAPRLAAATLVAGLGMVGHAVAEVIPAPGYQATLFSPLNNDLSYQINLGSYTAGGDLLVISRAAVDPVADHNVLAIDELGNDAVVSLPAQYPSGDRYGVDTLPHESSPNLAYLLDAGRLLASGNLDGRLFLLDLLTGNSTVLINSGEMLDPFGMDRDPTTGDILIADGGRIDVNNDGAIYRWNGSTLSTVVNEGIDPFDVLFVADGTYYMSGSVAGVSGVYRMSGGTVLQTFATLPSAYRLAWNSIDELMPVGLYVTSGFGPGSVYWLPDQDNDFIADSTNLAATAGNPSIAFDPLGRLLIGDSAFVGGNNVIAAITQSCVVPPCFQGLGDLPGGAFDSSAYSLSGDGTTVVGRSAQSAGFEAIRWQAETGMVGLGDLPGGTFFGLADDVSGNGDVVAGTSDSETSSGYPYEAFRWTSATGVTGLGGGGFSRSTARGISENGAIIVGWGDMGDIAMPFRWTSATGMQALPIPPGQLGVAMAISNDGQKMYGWAGPTNLDTHMIR
ncbi:MAG TPA: hypothetical protein VNT79_06430, partial [Phycisphaerae bacterium]|nr:hypothetical protein [Phycisphaerae bacterium]